MNKSISEILNEVDMSTKIKCLVKRYDEFICTLEVSMAVELQELCGVATVDFSLLNYSELNYLKQLLTTESYVNSIIDRYYLGEEINQNIKNKWKKDTSYIIKDKRGYYLSSYGQSNGRIFYHRLLGEAIRYIIAVNFIDATIFKTENILF